MGCKTAKINYNNENTKTNPKKHTSEVRLEPKKKEKKETNIERLISNNETKEITIL